MTFRGTAALVLSVVAFGAWLAIATGLVIAPPVSNAPQSSPVASPLDPVIRSVQSQSARLHTYLASVPQLVPPVRDPFAFSRSASSGVGGRLRVSATAPDGAAAATATARPALTLAGIAEEGSPDAPVRTAVISGMGQLFLVKESETFGGRFEIVRVGADSALVRDGLDRSTFTLTLK
jgi:hypothetical protein